MSLLFLFVAGAVFVVVLLLEIMKDLRLTRVALERASDLAFERDVQAYARQSRLDFDRGQRQERHRLKRANRWRLQDYAVAVLGVACCVGWYLGR